MDFGMALIALKRGLKKGSAKAEPETKSQTSTKVEIMF